MEHSTALIGPTSGWVGPWSAALSGSLDDCGVCRVGGGVIFVFQIEHIDIAISNAPTLMEVLSCCFSTEALSKGFNLLSYQCCVEKSSELITN